MDRLTLGKALDMAQQSIETERYRGKFAKNPNSQFAKILRDPVLRDWLENYDKGTREGYGYTMSDMLEFAEITSEALRTSTPEEVKRIAKNFMAYKIEQGRPGAVPNIYKATKSFCEHYDIAAKFKRGDRIRVGMVKTEHVPLPREVWALAEAASAKSQPYSPRNKAVILTAWTACFRENAVCKLREGALAGYSESDCPIPVRVGNEFQKIGSELWCTDDKISGYGLDYFYTFIPKVAFLAIREYQDWLRKIGKYDSDPKAYLFKPERASRRQGLSENSCWSMFHQAMPVVGIKPCTCNFHKLRDAWKSVMITAQVDSEVREAIMAHKEKGSGGNYFAYHDLEMIRKEYAKADWSRTSSHKLDKLQEENMELRLRITEMAADIQRLKQGGNNDLNATDMAVIRKIIAERLGTSQIQNG